MLLVNLLAALNFANVFKNKKTFGKYKNVKNVKKRYQKNVKNVFYIYALHCDELAHRAGPSATLTLFLTARRYASAMYAVVMCPSVCPSVRPSVRPSQAGILSKRLDESSWYFARRLPSTDPTLCCKEIWVSPKLEVLPPDSENFARGRSRCQQKLVVVVVDDDGRVC